MNIKNFKNKLLLNETLAINIANDIKILLTIKKNIWMVVSGGNTPSDLYKILSTKDIDWKRVNITLADERLVPISDSRSNEAMVRNTLIKNNASEAKLFGLNNNEIPLMDDCQSLSFLSEINEVDILILGMGTDGHTASFFSEDINLKGILDINNIKLFSIVSLENEAYDRVTLNFNLLSKAENIYLNITGQEKKIKLKHAIKVNNPLKEPISIFLNHKMEVYWSP